jgi:hypothetical protein
MILGNLPIICRYTNLMIIFQRENMYLLFYVQPSNYMNLKKPKKVVNQIK